MDSMNQRRVKKDTIPSENVDSHVPTTNPSGSMSSTSSLVIKLSVCLACGVVFGWSLEKGRVFSAPNIRLQMVFQRYVMLKMFLSAAGVGQLVMVIASIAPGLKDNFERAMSTYASTFCVKGVLTSTLGPFLLGAGMTISGACPGMVLSQIGSFAKNAEYTLLGVLCGSLVYGVFAARIVAVTLPEKPLKNNSIHQTLGVAFGVVALPLALIMLLVVYGIETLVPWDKDLDCWDRNEFASAGVTNYINLRSWPPYVAGALIGLLQLPIMMTVSDTLGSSSSYVTVVSQWLVTPGLRRAFPYLAAARTGLANWWMVVYVTGAALGGYLSASSSSSLATSAGVSAVAGLTGGFLMAVGSRLASGCTSGHGLSGMGMLYWLSIVAVPAMFGGAICVAVGMKSAGILTDFSCHDPANCPPIPSMDC